uniref:Uncharacterized protein n=1 Tax=Trypanosoma vivax (strain Y486) TaxID=1055687 RepID=G0TZW1_TRYVY|nr:hypothetical protein TVY486_0807460 [Trypanosoma vivax Y486]
MFLCCVWDVMGLLPLQHLPHCNTFLTIHFLFLLLTRTRTDTHFDPTRTSSTYSSWLLHFYLAISSLFTALLTHTNSRANIAVGCVVITVIDWYHDPRPVVYFI